MNHSDAVQKQSPLFSVNRRLPHAWSLYSLFLLTLLFTFLAFYFSVTKHNAFNTRTYDFGRFSQAIWNVLHGRFLFTSIDYRSILGNHFSPYMALLAPLLLIWPDERALLFFQAASVAAAGLFLSLILYRRHPALAVLLLLSFFLNPAVHSLTLYEFRRVVLIMPFLALALLALDRGERVLMLAALLIALLGKEDIGLFVLGVGIFLLLVKRDLWWGLGLIVLGLGWSTIVTLWIIPAFRAPGSEYPQLFYFNYLGNTYAEIIATVRRDPFILQRQLFGIDRLAAVRRLLLPLGIFLPFLAADWLLIALPSLLLLLLSGDAEMYGLLKWYPATILPVFFAATAVGISKSSRSRAWLLIIWLLLTTILGYWLYSPLPGGREYDPGLYDVTDHDLRGLQMVERVPNGASVAAQPHYVPHLALRENVFHYPWIKIGRENVDFFLFDRQSNPYPLSNDEFSYELTQFLIDPSYTVIAETDDIYLLQQTGNAEPAFTVEQTVEDMRLLYGFDIAQQGEDGFFHPANQQPLSIEPGQRLKVVLYWEALGSSEAERMVSVRLVDGTGWLNAQHDGIPGMGSKPTSWWQPGQKFRDIHYIDIPEALSDESLSLELVLYDTFTQEVIPWRDGEEKVQLAELIATPR